MILLVTTNIRKSKLRFVDTKTGDSINAFISKHKTCRRFIDLVGEHKNNRFNVFICRHKDKRLNQCFHW